MLVQHLPGRAALVVLAAALMVGCTVTNPGSDKIDYRGAKPTREALDVPPGLSTLPPNDRFAVPGAVSASQAGQASAQRPPVPGAATVVATTQVARIERAGQQRWLAVDLPPEQVFPVVREFWPSVGLTLERDDAALGIVETVWSENRAMIPQDIIRRTIGRVFDGLYSSGERDRFRTRLERTAKNTTEVFISHRGMEEVFTNAARDSTRWQPRPSDPELEAEMLQRLLLRFAPNAPTVPTTTVAATAPAAARPVGATGPAPTAAGAASAGAATGAAAATGGSTVAQTQTVRLIKGATGSAERVEIDEPFDRAWRRVGLGLDRGAFTVEDRDRANGVYFVRYLDPDVEAKQRSQQGMFSKLFGSDPKIVAPQYRVLVTTRGAASVVTVLDKDGKPESSPSTDRILTLLNQQLR
jgi:outer membrane protein assembly factor BamC